MPTLRRPLRQGRLPRRRASRGRARSSTRSRSTGAPTSAACRRSTASRSTSSSLEEAQCERFGFGAVKARRQPLPMCRAEVSTCYANRSGELGCVNPEFFELPQGRAVLPRRSRAAACGKRHRGTRGAHVHEADRSPRSSSRARAQWMGEVLPRRGEARQSCPSAFCSRCASQETGMNDVVGTRVTGVASSRSTTARIRPSCCAAACGRPGREAAASPAAASTRRVSHLEHGLRPDEGRPPGRPPEVRALRLQRRRRGCPHGLPRGRLGQAHDGRRLRPRRCSARFAIYQAAR